MPTRTPTADGLIAPEGPPGPSRPSSRCLRVMPATTAPVGERACSGSAGCNSATAAGLPNRESGKVPGSRRSSHFSLPEISARRLKRKPFAGFSDPDSRLTLHFFSACGPGSIGAREHPIPTRVSRGCRALPRGQLRPTFRRSPWPRRTAAAPIRTLKNRLTGARNFLLAHRCADGGWNHGAKQALGVDTPSYPETTGTVLLALAGQLSGQGDASFAPSIARAEAWWNDCPSCEAASWLALGLGAIGRAKTQLPAAALKPRTIQDAALRVIASSGTRGTEVFL